MATFVFVHGGGGSGWDFHLVDASLRELGHDVVAPDLPITDSTAGLKAFTDTVLDAIGDRQDLVVVGHSYGGFTAPLVCAARPARLLVFLAGMIPAPGEKPGDWWGNTGFSSDPELSDDEKFFNDVPPALVAESKAHGRDQASAEWGEPWPLEALPDVPTRVLLCRDDRFFTPDFQRRVARERLGVVPDEIDGPHLVPLSHPAQLARHLVGYL